MEWYCWCGGECEQCALSNSGGSLGGCESFFWKDKVWLKTIMLFFIYFFNNTDCSELYANVS